jgi:hypothetical protein
MALSLHHVFLLTEPEAPAADALVELGLVEGSRNVHPGQGSANRRFFFEDLYLELVYFTDENEARTGAGSVIRSLDRYRAAEGSPIGLIFRADSGEDLSSFPSFPYQPSYFDEGVFFSVGDNAGRLDEPSCIVLPVPVPVPQAGPEPRSGVPFSRVSRVAVSVPTKEPSAVLAAAGEVDRVALQPGRQHLLEIEFGDAAAEADLRPEMPLVVRW